MPEGDFCLHEKIVFEIIECSRKFFFKLKIGGLEIKGVLGFGRVVGKL